MNPAILLVEARRVDAEVDRDEYTAARLCASEFADGSPAELACIVDTEASRARRKKLTLTAHLTGGTGLYGPQGGKRPASTARNPTLRHLVAARAVLQRDLEGIAKGAVRFFDPKAQELLYRRYVAGKSEHKHTCSALGLLRAWSFDLPPCNGHGRCCGDGEPPVGNPGAHTEAWVGPIAGVDAYHLMLMAPLPVGPAHQAAFDAARAVIAVRGTPNV